MALPPRATPLLDRYFSEIFCLVDRQQTTPHRQSWTCRRPCTMTQRSPALSGSSCRKLGCAPGSSTSSRSKFDSTGLAELICHIPFVLLRLPHHRVRTQLDRILATSPIIGAEAVSSRKEGGAAAASLSFAEATQQPQQEQDRLSPGENTTAVSTPATARNRFARSFSQLVASQLVSGDLVTMAKSKGILTNMGVDYVVVFRFATTGILHYASLRQHSH